LEKIKQCPSIMVIEHLQFLTSWPSTWHRSAMSITWITGNIYLLESISFLKNKFLENKFRESELFSNVW
jgi:hypothetical protein